jgi:hypothetical protein
MKVARLSALRTGRLYPQEISWYSFLLEAESTPGPLCGRKDYVNEKFQCELLRKEVSYLGHVISENGVLPDKAKTKVIEKFPTPQNVKQLKSFLGLMIYYRRFIPRFSTLASPLHQLLKKDAKYEWTDRQEQALRGLKSRLISPPILRYPDYSRKFSFTTDASSEGVGAVLSQGEIGKIFRKLSPVVL